MSKKTPADVMQEVKKFLQDTTDVYSNPDIAVSIDTTGYADSIVISSKTRFVGIMPEEGTGGRYLVIKVFYGIENDLKSREERVKDGSRVVQGNDYFVWSHDNTFLGKLLFPKDQADRAAETPEKLDDLLDDWIEELHLV